MRGLNLLDNLWQDFRFAVRQLRKTPGFTATAILMLALGMCASVAIFAFVDAALLKPLPVRIPPGSPACSKASPCSRAATSLISITSTGKS